MTRHRITYARLLDIIWESHRPTGRNTSGQYMNAIFYHDDAQQQTALASKAALEKKLGKSVTTRVLPVRSFTMAEDYHQKYILKQNKDLMRELTRYLSPAPGSRGLNCGGADEWLCGGNGTADQLSRELSSLGLSADGEKRSQRNGPVGSCLPNVRQGCGYDICCKATDIAPFLSSAV